MPTLLRVAILCGVTPLITGFAIYVSWRQSRSEWLISAGFVNIAVGLVLFVSGVICLSMRSTRITSGGPDVHRRLSNFRKLAWVLLIVNFPAALLIALSVIDVQTRYTVTVINESSRPIQSLLLKGPGVSVEAGSISPKKSLRKHLQFSGDGSLDFEIRSEQSKTNGVVEDYVTGGLGGAKTIRINGDGSIKLEPVPR